ncbi:MAG: aminopeptidase [Candidatus Zixiibacteriota bacterium]
MFDSKSYFKKFNEKAVPNYKQSIIEITQIRDQYAIGDYPGENEYYDFNLAIANKILKFARFEEELGDKHFEKLNFEELKKENTGFYEEIIGDNYNTSYANPSYCVEVFGDKFGQLFSYFYMMYRQYVTYSFLHKIFEMNELNQLFIKFNKYIRNNKPDYEELKNLITDIERRDKTEERIIGWKQYFDPEFKFYTDTVMNSDLDDLSYLFKFNTYITENEIKIAKFLQNYPDDKIQKLAKMVVKAYRRGFERENKPLDNKKTATLMFNAGMERIIRHVIRILKEDMGLEAIISNVSSKAANKQYSYDHRFDTALFIDEDFVEKAKNESQKAAETVKGLMEHCSGVVYFGKFGEKPFQPENKEETLKLSDEQQKLYQIHQNNQMQIQNKYYSREKSSFTAISFPSPDIDGDFEAIFEDILEINMLDSDTYEKLQQKIVDALDLAEYIIVKGKDDNETDMKVVTQEIKNPNKETNFLNCGADVNIPVGEVFTSPKLEGTEGTLHIKETYLGSLRYENLKLYFKDGYIIDYSCTNFDDEKSNKRYIHENLLLPHETLPIGEFAIGTNTLAYVVSRKHDILDVLPVLIIEKMGPHFAIGDTCFTYTEDKPVFNPDSKEIIARDNEKTILRKTDPSKAYTYKHMDITLPYDSLDHISVITKCGKEVDIIRDGRFVLPGTEKLNEPLDNR